MCYRFLSVMVGWLLVITSWSLKMYANNSADYYCQSQVINTCKAMYAIHELQGNGENGDADSSTSVQSPQSVTGRTTPKVRRDKRVRRIHFLSKWPPFLLPIYKLNQQTLVRLDVPLELQIKVLVS